MAVTTNNSTYTTPLYVGGCSGYPNSTITAANTSSPTLKIGGAGQLTLLGADADLVINGVSLNETLKSIQDRLNILRPSKELEAEWDELKELGELYRQKETELKEKQRAWDILRKQE
jgi:hypothetical protein